MNRPAGKLRIAFFGTSSRFSLLALQSLMAHQSVVAAVQARPKARKFHRSLLRWAGLRPSPVEKVAHQHGIPVIEAFDGGEPMLAERLRELRPDLICIAVFPRLIPQMTLDLAPAGAINVHASLLPRHRGPLPLFWTYHADDRAAGITVHHASQTFDAGDVILQDSVPLARGYPVERLNEDVGKRGAILLCSAVKLLAAGRAPRLAQDEEAATFAPLVRSGAPLVRFDEWDVERVWHFLAALCPRFREPLVDLRGLPAIYQRVAGFERGPAGTHGSLETVSGGWKLQCRGGVVLLAENA